MQELICTKFKGKDVKSCLRASEEQIAKCREALEENKSKKVEEKEDEEEEISIIKGRTRKIPINVGVINQFARQIKVDDASEYK